MYVLSALSLWCRQVLILLKDIVKFTRQSDASGIMPELERIIEVIITETASFGSIITSECVLPMDGRDSFVHCSSTTPARV